MKREFQEGPKKTEESDPPEHTDAFASALSKIAKAGAVPPALPGAILMTAHR